MLLLPSRLRHTALILVAAALMAVALSACDATETAAPLALGSSTLDDRGPALSAFPTASLMDMTEAEALLADSTALRTSSGDTLVFVPLVFDDDGFLHSPESFKELLIALEASPGLPPNPDVYFTDLTTFDSVLASSGNTASGRSRVDLYAGGRRGRLPVAGFEASSGAVPAYVEVYDPYVLPELLPPPCDDDPEFIGCDDGGGSGGGGGGGGGRSTSDAPPEYGTTINWPTLWKGDIFSGDTEGGFGSSGSQNIGHSSIVTQLDGGGNTGGSILSYSTKVMEAVGDRPNVQDEIVERAARIYWIDNQVHVNHVKVRYHPQAGWTERDDAIAYARFQDPDYYSAFCAKWTVGKWYCSKLVWKAYKEATGDDIDWDWGYWVFPEDIEGSRVLRTVYHFVHS